VAATSAIAKADPTHPSAINQANQPILDMVGQGGEVLGSTGGPHIGHNRNAYPYGLPPNYAPPITVHMPNENANHTVPVPFEGQQPQPRHIPFVQPVGDTHEEPWDHAQGDFEPYPMFTVEGPSCSGMPQTNAAGVPHQRPLQPLHFSVGRLPPVVEEKEKLELIEERLRAIEGIEDYLFAYMAELCLGPLSPRPT